MRILTQMKVSLTVSLLLLNVPVLALSDGKQRYMYTQFSFNFPVTDSSGEFRSFVFVLRADAKNPGFTEEEREEVQKLLEREMKNTELFLFLTSGKSEGCGGYDSQAVHKALSDQLLPRNEKIYRLRIACDVSNRRRKSEF